MTAHVLECTSIHLATQCLMPGRFREGKICLRPILPANTKAPIILGKIRLGKKFVKAKNTSIVFLKGPRFHFLIESIYLIKLHFIQYTHSMSKSPETPEIHNQLELTPSQPGVVVEDAEIQNDAVFGKIYKGGPDYRNVRLLQIPNLDILILIPRRLVG